MISTIIPTYNASKYLERFFKIALNKLFSDYEFIIIDSSSSDNTIEIAKSHGAKVLIIPKEQFEHGKTRTLAGKAANGEILIYLTQDSLLYDNNSIEKLIEPFYKDEKIGMVFGRQIPNHDASLFASHLRLFNYKSESYIRTYNDRFKYGLKTIFCSDAFAAYRKSVLDEIGWFKEGLIFGEDTQAAARILQKGFKIAYQADACVYHSHNYSIIEDFKRYFDMGIFHASENWLLKEFGMAEGEGVKYIKSEFTFLINMKKYHLFPEYLLRNLLKFIGYKLGRIYKYLPRLLCRKLSMNKTWWHK